VSHDSVELVRREVNSPRLVVFSDVEHKPKMLVAEALVNKMARTIWAALKYDTLFRDLEKVIAA
jgi:hypothetical protein